MFTEQQLWNQQVAISFLLGLDWRIPQGMQLVRARERTIKQLQDIIKADETGLFPRSDDLQAQLTVAHDRVTHLKQSLAAYRINPQYHELESEANRLTAEIARSLDEDVWDREQVGVLEQAPAGSDLDEWFRAWREATRRGENPYDSPEVREVLRKRGLET